MISSPRFFRFLLTVFLSVIPAHVYAQAQPAPAKEQFEPRVGQEGKDVVWVPSPQAVVDKMLDMAKVTPKDYVIDLGSGDGRTVITAAKRGAKALGMESEIGSLETGKRADIIAIDLSALEQQPLYDPVSTLIYTNVTSHIRHSWINGKAVLKDRKPLHLDLDKLREKAQQWQQKISPQS